MDWIYGCHSRLVLIQKCTALNSSNIIGISFGNGQNKHNSYDYDITTDKQRLESRKKQQSKSKSILMILIEESSL